jgi:uncharacterized membrane-anchored protein
MLTDFSTNVTAGRHSGLFMPMDTPSARRLALHAAFTKVPEVTAAFWAAKIVTTGLGETASDFLVRQFEPLVVIPIAGVALGLALAWQWLIPTFSKWGYWLAVGLVAVFGTMIADALHVVMGVSYALSTTGFGLALAAVFLSWRLAEGTLSIHSITTRRREAFYWAAVVVTFALGTAAGDWTATSLGLGYLVSGVVFVVLFTLPLEAHRLVRRYEVLAFWVSYILTRPLGASFADWVGVPAARGGLGLGTALVSIVLLAIAIGIVAIWPFEAATARDD